MEFNLPPHPKKEEGVYIGRDKSDFIPDRTSLVYLKLMAESGTFLAPGSGCKAPQNTLMALSIYSFLGRNAGKTQ
jgi:hypothetical protein